MSSKGLCCRCGRDTGFAFVAGTLAVSSIARREAARGEAAECRRHFITDRCHRRCFRQKARWSEWCRRVQIQNPIDDFGQLDHYWFASQSRLLRPSSWRPLPSPNSLVICKFHLKPRFPNEIISNVGPITKEVPELESCCAASQLPVYKLHHGSSY